MSTYDFIKYCTATLLSETLYTFLQALELLCIQITRCLQGKNIIHQQNIHMKHNYKLVYLTKKKIIKVSSHVCWYKLKGK